LIGEYLSDTEECLKLDIDRGSEFEVLKKILNARWLFGDKMKLYKTTNGFHIRVDGVKSDLDLRHGLGDDKGRIEWSEVRGGDVLFTRKRRYMLKKVGGEVRAFKVYTSEEREVDVDWVIRELPWIPKWNPRIKKGRKRVARRWCRGVPV